MQAMTLHKHIFIELNSDLGESDDPIQIKYDKSQAGGV